MVMTEKQGLQLKVYELTDESLVGDAGKWVVADQGGWLPGQFDTVDDAVDAWKRANDIL